MKDDGGVRYWTRVIGCDCQVYRDGALIATVKSDADSTHYLDLDVVAGQKYAYVINAMGVNSNRREVTCERNNIKDVYPEVTDDSEMAAALEGSADAKLAGSPMSPSELREAVGIKSRIHFSRYYMTPLMEKGLVERTDPENPMSPRQEYKLA